MKRRKCKSRHHLIARSRGGTNEESNIREVPIHKHEAWHTLFGNALPEEILVRLLDDWFPEGHFTTIACMRKDGSTYVVHANKKLR